MRKIAIITAAAATAVLAVGGISAASADTTTKTVTPHAKSLLAAGDVVRVAGADRYETAVAVSRISWTPDTASVVFLTSGENFPDALSVGPSSEGAGPILLTRPGALPDVTRGELARLQPCAIVVVGGSAAVSDAVAADAAQYADSSACS